MSSGEGPLGAAKGNLIPRPCPPPPPPARLLRFLASVRGVAQALHAQHASVHGGGAPFVVAGVKAVRKERNGSDWGGVRPKSGGCQSEWLAKSFGVACEREYETQRGASKACRVCTCGGLINRAPKNGGGGFGKRAQLTGIINQLL